MKKEESVDEDWLKDRGMLRGRTKIMFISHAVMVFYVDKDVGAYL